MLTCYTRSFNCIVLLLWMKKKCRVDLHNSVGHCVYISDCMHIFSKDIFLPQWVCVSHRCTSLSVCVCVYIKKIHVFMLGNACDCMYTDLEVSVNLGWGVPMQGSIFCCFLRLHFLLCILLVKRVCIVNMLFLRCR